MPVWNIEPVNEVPEVTLAAWQVFEVPLDGDDGWTRHFVGYARELRQGQVCSPVLSFDPTTRSGVTRSGRVYRLAGRPGLGSDALYVWNQWKAIHGITEERDVTAAVAQMFDAAPLS
jgi:hypothetical protein